MSQKRQFFRWIFKKSEYLKNHNIGPRWQKRKTKQGLKTRGRFLQQSFIYHIIIKYTKLPQNIPNVRKIHRPNGHKVYQHLPLQEPQKFTHIGIFGLKICHLATLMPTATSSSTWCMPTSAFHNTFSADYTCI
jgi:hypothetical protein